MVATAIVATLSLFIFAPLVVEATSTCRGPRTPGELRKLLWGEGSGYDPRTRPGVAKAAANMTPAIDNASNISIYDGTGGLYYEGNVLPFEASPDVVRLQIHMLSINEVDQKKREFQVNIWLRQKWNDYRLQYASASQRGCFSDTGREGFPEAMLKEIWAPDIYVANRVKVDSEVAGSFWIYPNGDVAYTAQSLVRLACSMNFNSFPHDTQTCGVKIGTFLEDAKGIILEPWDDRPPITREYCTV